MTGHIRTLALASALGLGLVAEAQAHAHLKSSTPAMGATIATSPSELVLSFSGGVNAKFTGVKVEGLDHAAVATGEARLGPGGDTTLMVPVTGALPAGTYKVNWHALAVDGHKTEGSYTFTIKP